jgi:predicted nucleic acid-binding protein
MTGYMLDTNIFNAVLDQAVDLSAVKEAIFYCTHVQSDEIQQTRNELRRQELEQTFKAVEAKKVVTASAVWGVSKFDASSWDAGDDLVEKLTQELEGLDRSSRKKPSTINQSRDALITHTCISNGFILVTNDKNLRSVTENNGGKSISLDEFLGT